MEQNLEMKAAENLLQAFIGAYVWVASSDKGVEQQEYVKFSHVIVQSPFATQFEEDHIRRYFKDTVTLFESDYVRAVSIIKAELIALIGKDHFCQEVIRISRAACVGDGQLSDVEEAVLNEIAETMKFSGAV
jgi:tellurite resistance protein